MQILRRLSLVVLLCTAAQAIAATYYAAPAALGDGSGSSSSNAAYYGNATFWNSVQSTLAGQAVTVYLVDGGYNSVALDLSDKGNATYQLTIQGVSVNGAVFNASVNSELLLVGSRNIMIKNVNFIGSNCKYSAIELKRNSSNHCRDITIDACRFEDLNNIGTNPLITGGAAINITYADTYNITVKNSTFKRIGKDKYAHIFYVKFDAHNITINNNVFQDCSGSHLKFRAGVDYVNIYSNSFSSTGSWANEKPLRDDTSQRGLIFIDVQNNNSSSSGTEIFGNNYSIYNNSYSFASLGTTNRVALAFYHSQYDVGGFNQIPTGSEVTTLTSGGPNYKLNFLTAAGINPSLWTIYGNTYTNVKQRISYDWNPGSIGGASISNALGQNQVWNYGFEGDTGDPDGWTVVEAANATVSCTTTSAGHGTTSVRLSDTSASPESQYCQIYKPLVSSITRGYYRSYVKVESNGTSPGDHMVVFTNGATPIYWVKAFVGGTWGNGSTTFSGSWTTGVWYLVEMEFNFGSDTYTVWINNVKRASSIAIPTTATSMSGNLTIKPANTTVTGTMLVDFLKLATYEP